MSYLVKRRPQPTSFTRNVTGVSFKYVAALAVVAIITSIAVVPFLMAIIN